jgi:hypothetical protein
MLQQPRSKLNKTELNYVMIAAASCNLNDINFLLDRVPKYIMQRFLKPWLYPQVCWKLPSLGKETGKLVDILHGFPRK